MPSIAPEHLLPGAIVRPIPEAFTQSTIAPRLIIIHTAAGFSDSLWSFWQQAGVNVESHLYSQLDGGMEQYLGFNVRGDANRHANRWFDAGTAWGAISIESQNARKPWSTDPFTPEQVESIIRACVHLCRRYGIPARKADGPFGWGIGYHIQFGAPGPWTPVAKECPGRERIRQVIEIIIPEVARRVAGGAPASPLIPGDDDMFTDADRAMLRDTQAAARGANAGALVAIAETRAVAKVLANTAARVRSMHSGNYGEGSDAAPGDLRWADRRFTALRNHLDLALAGLSERLGHPVKIDDMEAAFSAALIDALGDRTPNDLSALVAAMPTADLKGLGAVLAEELTRRSGASTPAPV